MGFTRPRRIAHVKIADGDYAGLELDLSLSVSLGDFIAFQRNRGSEASTLDTQAEAFEWFGENVLEGWNLEEDDEAKTPVKADLAGWHSLEPALAIAIINRWRDAVTEVELPLGSRLSVSSASAPSTTTRRAVSSSSRRRSSQRK